MFDPIANDWAKKRQKPWVPFLELFNQYFPLWLKQYTNKWKKKENNELIFADIGCGSGRHHDFLSEQCVKLLNLDISIEMLKNLPKDSLKIQADMTKLPFRNSSFDGLISIAAIHHIKGQENRIQMIEEFKRVGRQNSLVSITVWRLYQKKFRKQFFSHYRIYPPYKDGFEPGDVIVPWIISQKDKKTTINRFYHLFKIGEFFKLMRNFEIIKIKTMGKSSKIIKNSKYSIYKENNKKIPIKSAKPNIFFIGRVKK